MTAEISLEILAEAQELINEAPDDCPKLVKETKMVKIEGMNIEIIGDSVNVECPGVDQPVCEKCPVRHGFTFSQRKEKK